MAPLDEEQRVEAARFILDALGEIGETWSCIVGGLAVRLRGKVNRVVKVEIVNTAPLPYI
jgi:hypothetical protein